MELDPPTPPPIPSQNTLDEQLAYLLRLRPDYNYDTTGTVVSEREGVARDWVGLGGEEYENGIQDTTSTWRTQPYWFPICLPGFIAIIQNRPWFVQLLNLAYANGPEGDEEGFEARWHEIFDENQEALEGFMLDPEHPFWTAINDIAVPYGVQGPLPQPLQTYGSQGKYDLHADGPYPTNTVRDFGRPMGLLIKELLTTVAPVWFRFLRNVAWRVMWIFFRSGIGGATNNFLLVSSMAYETFFIERWGAFGDSLPRPTSLYEMNYNTDPFRWIYKNITDGFGNRNVFFWGHYAMGSRERVGQFSPWLPIGDVPIEGETGAGWPGDGQGTGTYLGWASFGIDAMKYALARLPDWHGLAGEDGLQPSGIAPDYLLKQDPSNNPSEDIPRLPNWDYETNPHGPLPRSDTAINNWRSGAIYQFDNINKTLARTEDDRGIRTDYFYLTDQAFATTVKNYITYKANNPPPPDLPDGSVSRPFPGLGTMSVSGAYNYSFTFSGSPTTCAVLVAPMTDTTGWSRPIPAPTQVASPNNNYVAQTGAWLRAYWTGILRRTYNFATQFPTFAQEYDIELDQNTTAVSLTMTNCAGLNSGNAIFISADIPLTAQNTKVFANNTYLLPVYRPNGELYITCNHATSSADTFIVIFENAQMEWISLWKAIGWSQ
jgi:hypothetical protein